MGEEQRSVLRYALKDDVLKPVFLTNTTDEELTRLNERFRK